MSAIFEHFWLICGLWVGVGGYLYGQFKSRRIVMNGIMNRSEVNSLLKGYLACILIPSILFWVIGLSVAGPKTPFFNLWPNPQKILASIVLFSCWGLLLYWVLLGTGSSKLIKLSMLTSNMPRNWLTPSIIKIVTVIIVLVGVSSYFSNGI